jgi:predicted enzyme related to lactoylglutathione lyase
VISVTCVTFDCLDPERVARFWAEALGWRVSHVEADGARVDPPDGDMYLEFVKVPEPKTVKNRLHLGTSTDAIDAEIERLHALGATIAWEEEFAPDVAGTGFRNVILRDPEGNEFCLGTALGSLRPA